MLPESSYNIKATPEEYELLARRMGADKLAQRMQSQETLWRKLARGKSPRMHGEQALPPDRFIKKFFRYTGLIKPGRKNLLQLRLERNHACVRGLPQAFAGMRILQISDPHFDIDPGILGALINLTEGLQYDIAILTGDYRNSTRRDFRPPMEALGALAARLNAPAYGVLGNHDYIEMVPPIERLGIRVLLNESVPLERGGETLHIAGIDDSTYARTHDLGRARAGVPEGQCAILLSHSPNIHREAAQLGYALTLAGHTHGGQVCLPGGFAPVNNSGVPRSMISGPWTYGGMPGYTCRGAGACCVPVRFNCPPEVTLHTLQPL